MGGRGTKPSDSTAVYSLATKRKKTGMIWIMGWNLNGLLSLPTFLLEMQISRSPFFLRAIKLRAQFKYCLFELVQRLSNIFLLSMIIFVVWELGSIALLSIFML